MSATSLYLEELDTNFLAIKDKLDNSDISGVEKLLEEARELIALIEISRPPNNPIAQYKQQYATYKKRVDDLKYTSLKSGGTTTITTSQIRAQEIQDNQMQRLDATSKQIQDALRVAHETEEIGRNSMTLLHSQRQQMEGMNGKVEDINQSLDKSSKELSAMERRNKIFKVLTFGLA